MEYYCKKDALSEGVLVRTELLCDLNNSHIQEALKNKKIKEKSVFLPYYLVDALVTTEYLQVKELITEKSVKEMEGAPEYVNLQGKILYRIVSKICKKYAMEEERETVRQMHLARAIKWGSLLAEDGEEEGCEREEEEILHAGRTAWRSGR
ncbi:hypothetical protein NEAUS04_1990 [Nematocida ausubeli]|uniref:Uncharacterized protein n=1 Tax=Nematocida ausubeli (strain ATCC PRA-371 / ERTm2) TaxID=1913371 RepID=H8ZA47_NEMA1|nr:uncharacterized protein NESG_00638 [Nematocida ausubeli]EHY66828.1 hypothetical protein NERG_00468 [Nematocida ausubeli]KAI5132944.1 hypothetical protein NEAUS06_0439 [Nematocida ausubeli]KAI5137235.1 hypothetical protein NEAUS07_1894 [Nematocida ausubeli]KAI5137707.1 hypothetical protein NEAUS07_2121 [Nematocida ausubeli]KAI5149876.1 hypothetical protein NEAUS05_1944 [Nematocida ausubeli]